MLIGAAAPTPPRPRNRWQGFVPKLVTVFREGYRLSDFRSDAIAGLTVAIVALPLAMAIAIASGTTPDKGLITAIIAGFLISALGGSRVQIGGPTGAFIVVVYSVIQKYGFDGLVLATLMAGAMLVIAGLLRFGDWIKYIPEPVVTGFTAGIAVIIFTSQLRDLLGLSMHAVPADFLPKVAAFWAARDTLSIPAVAIAAGSTAAIFLLRKYAPKIPGFLLVVAGGAALVAVAHVHVDTIGSRFGGIPSQLPSPVLPHVSIARLGDLMKPAFTIAFLAGIESLLSAMVADGMTGRRHRSNCELVAQGVANIASALFGGISATGAIARTATNVRSGGHTPVAGMMHAVFVLASMLLLGPLMAYIPLASLAAILVVVAWNMSEQEHVRYLMGGPIGDRVVLAATFGLTVLVDLTTAIGVGITLSAVIFMHRMAEATRVLKAVDDEDDADDTIAVGARAALPRDVEMFDLRGPLFFGATSRLNDAFDAAFPPPKVFLLRLAGVPIADVSGIGALKRFIKRCDAHGVSVVFTEPSRACQTLFERMGVFALGNVLWFLDFDSGIRRAELIANSKGR